MMKTIKYSIVVAFICLIQFISWNGLSQHRIEDIKQIKNRAMEMAPENRAEYISQQINEIESFNFNDKEKSAMYFTAGYFYQKLSEEDYSHRDLYEEKAAEYYENALNYNSDQILIMKNLYVLYLKSNRLIQAKNILTRLNEIDPDHSPIYLKKLGKLYERMEDFSNAINCYSNAFNLNTDDIGVVYDIFDIYLNKKEGTESLQECQEFCNTLLKMQYWELAAKGYEELMKKTNYSNTSIFENSLGKWVEAKLFSKTFMTDSTNKVLYALPRSKKPVAELEQILASPIKNSGILSWWNDTPFRKHLLASVYFNMADYYFIAGDNNAALHLLETSNQIAPRFREYHHNDEIGSYKPIKLDISLQLMKLYNNDYKLYEREISTLINEVFNEKKLYYLNLDRESYLLCHTLLALMFVDQGIWSNTQPESKWYAYNAIFQLERATEIHERIVREGQENYKPIPKLYSLLAEGYMKENNTDEAFKSNLKAIEGYLDTDNLNLAKALIQFNHSLAYNDQTQNSILEELEHIYSLRKFIDSTEINTNEVFDRTINFSNNYSKQRSELGKSFVNRQKFKILSDAGRKYLAQNKINESTVLFTKALNSIDQEKALGNLYDIERLKLIGSKLSSKLENENNVDVSFISNTQLQEDSKSIRINSDGYESNVKVANDLIQISKAQNYFLDENNNAAVKGLKDIYLDNNKVVFPRSISTEYRINENLSGTDLK